MNLRKLKVGSYLEAECKALVPEGLGLVHLERELFFDKYKPLTGFVWGVLPGERFVARLTRVHSSYFHAVLAQRSELPDTWIGRTSDSLPEAHEHFALFNLAKERREVPCINFTLCGGCKLLHLNYADTLAYKKSWLILHLQRQRLAHPEIMVEPSPLEFTYRNHVQVHINSQKERGFYAPYSYRVKPFPKEGCLLFDQKLFEETFPKEYELSRCVRSRIDSYQRKVLTLPLYSPQDKSATFTYVVAFPAGSFTWVTLPNTAFFQVNTAILPHWLHFIGELLRQIPFKDKLSILELFSGFGFITRMLSYQLPLEVVAADILSEKDLLKVKINNENMSPLANFTFSYLKVDLSQTSHLPKAFNKLFQEKTFDVLLLNPPRGGLAPDSLRYFLSHIKWRQQPFLLYSSCNAATMARDLAVASEFNFKVTQIKLFDFFPYTAHYEVVALLEAKN